MLKRSKLLIAFLVVTVVCASIGFAAVSDTLTADGTVKVNVDPTENPEINQQFDADVYFQSVTLPDGVAYVGTAPTFDAETPVDDIDFTLTTGEAGSEVNALSAQGDTVTITAVIKNASQVQKVKLTTADTTIGTENVENCVSVVASFTGEVKTITIDPGETTTLKIVVTLDKIPDVNIDTTFTVSVQADPVT